MAGRKALVLTAKEINELGTHILNLPFKRRVEERCLHMLKNKKSLQDLSEQDRQLIQKCRYERNAYNKRMLQLQLIQQRMPTTKNMNRLIETAKTDPRNPFNKTPEQ